MAKATLIFLELSSSIDADIVSALIRFLLYVFQKIFNLHIFFIHINNLMNGKILEYIITQHVLLWTSSFQ